MRQLACKACGGSFPMKELVSVASEAFCKGCIEGELERRKAGGDGTVEAAPLIDPTVCLKCGKDNGEKPFDTVAGMPACADCAASLRTYTYPLWVKASFAALLALAAVAFARNWRFIMAHVEAAHAARSADLEVAAALMGSAAERVPESRELAAAAKMYRAILFLRQDKASEAIPLLRECKRGAPADAGVDRLLLQAESAAAFESMDYDAFLEKSKALERLDPKEPSFAAQVASAYACKYAVTSDEQFKRQALERLERASKMAGPDDASFKEYEERIRHRLETREIIPREEYNRRFRKAAGEGVK